MNPEQRISTEQSEPSTSAGSWGLRYPGFVMGKGGRNEVKEFTGMWRLKPDADLVKITKVLAPGGWLDPRGESFSSMTTKLGLIRTARWFVARTPGM
jgi:poly-D-alanine transfer protein DltD